MKTKKKVRVFVRGERGKNELEKKSRKRLEGYERGQEVV